MTKREKKKLGKERVIFLTERSNRAEEKGNFFMALVYLKELEAVLRFMKENQLIDRENYDSSLNYCVEQIARLS